MGQGPDVNPDADEGWRDTLVALGFRASGPYGAMHGVCRGIKFIAMRHPLGSLSLSATFVSTRQAYDNEFTLPINATAQQICQVIVKVVEDLGLDGEETLGPR